MLPYEHICSFTSMVNRKMTSKPWVSSRVGDWLRKNYSANAKEVQDKLKDEFHINATYNKTWSGMRDALDQIHGS
jgi:hypothetical protein